MRFRPFQRPHLLQLGALEPGHLDLVRREPAGDPRADPAEADDPGALAAQRGARIGHLAPAALADLAICLRDAVPHRQ